MPTEPIVPTENVDARNLVFVREDHRGALHVSFIPYEIVMLDAGAGSVQLQFRNPGGRPDLITLDADELELIVREVREAQAVRRRQSRELRRRPEVDIDLAERDV